MSSTHTAFEVVSSKSNPKHYHIRTYNIGMRNFVYYTESGGFRIMCHSRVDEIIISGDIDEIKVFKSLEEVEEQVASLIKAEKRSSKLNKVFKNKK
jgi:hypothetical protein